MVVLGRTVGWILMLLLSLMVMILAGVVLVTREFADELAPSLHAHGFALTLHIVGAIVTLVVGPFQFLTRLRNRHLRVHRILGRLYLLGVLAGGLGGLYYLAAFSYGGLTTHVAFGSLAVVWLATGVLAYRMARTRQIVEHRRWMIRNFALTFAAVTLRLWLPGLEISGVSFDIAYPIVAWLCWVLNLAVAEILIRASQAGNGPSVFPSTKADHA